MAEGEHGMEHEGAAKTREPVSRAFAMLSQMVDHDGLHCGVRELAGKLAIPPSSAFRVLKTLERGGMVVREGDGTYSLSSEFYRLARRAVLIHDPSRAVVPHIRDLREAIGETVAYGEYDPVREQVVFTAQAEAEHPLRYATQLNRWWSLLDGSSGMAIFAFLPEQTRRAIADRDRTVSTFGDDESIELEVRRTRADGRTLYRRTRPPLTVGISAPSWNPDGVIAGCVLVGIPAERFSVERESSIVTAVQRAAVQISRELGGWPGADLPLDAPGWEPYRSLRPAR